MKKHSIIISIFCCIAGYWVYEHYVPCVASSQEIIMKLTSPAFEHQSKLPIDYTCHGKNNNPPLLIQGVSAQAKSLVLVVSDPDAPQPQPWIHWVFFNISPKTTEINEAAPHVMLESAKRGKNSAQTLEYYGACPPQGHGIHHYHFMLYALDELLGLQEGVSYEEIKEAIQGHIVAQADLVGLYETK